MAEVRPISVVDQGEDAAADRDPRFALVAGLAPGLAEGVDLLRCWTWSGLPLSSNFRVEVCMFMPSRAAHAAVAFEAGAPPDPVAQAGECGSRRSRPGGFGNIGRGFGSQIPRPTAAPGRPRRAGAPCRRRPRPRRLVAEMAQAVDHLLRRAAADAELQPPAGDHVGRAGVLDHVERVLVAHVDHRRPDLDPAGAGPDRGQQRERRRELLGEVVHAEVGAVRAELLGRHRQLDRLPQRVRRRARLRVRRRRPMAEGQEPDALHGYRFIGGSARTCWTVDSTA